MLYTWPSAGCGNESRLAVSAHFCFQVGFKQLLSCIRIDFAAWLLRARRASSPEQQDSGLESQEKRLQDPATVGMCVCMMTSSLKTLLNDCWFYKRRVSGTSAGSAGAPVNPVVSELPNTGHPGLVQSGCFSSVLILLKSYKELNHLYVTFKA